MPHRFASWHKLFDDSFDQALAMMLKPSDDGPRIPDDLRPIPVAAVLAGLHVKSVYRLVEHGKLPAYGRRGALRVSMRDLLGPVEPRRNRLTKSAVVHAAPAKAQAKNTIAEATEQAPL